MRIRSHRRFLVLSNRPAPAEPPRPVSRARLVSRAQPVSRAGRVRRWLRLGAQLSVIGVLRCARTVLARRRLVLGVLGGLLLVFSPVCGPMTPVAFVSGLLLIGVAAPGSVPWTAETAMARLSVRSRPGQGA